jgi:hypothetical protein
MKPAECSCAIEQLERKQWHQNQHAKASGRHGVPEESDRSGAAIAIFARKK